MESDNTIRWTEEFSIGNPQIDQEHARIIELYNEMADALNRGFDRSRFAEILSCMFDYSLYHFRREEVYMQLIDYPDLEAHKAQHRNYNLYVTTLNADFFSVKALDPESILQFLSAWWRNHIQQIDSRYEQYKKSIHPELIIDWKSL